MDKSQYRLVKLIESSCQAPRKISDSEILAWIYHHQIEDFVEVTRYEFEKYKEDGGFTTE